MTKPNYQHIGKAEKPEIKLSTSVRSHKKQENSRKNIYFHFIDYTKAFDYADDNKLWKILQEMGLPDPLPASLETCVQLKKQWLEPNMEQ